MDRALAMLFPLILGSFLHSGQNDGLGLGRQFSARESSFLPFSTSLILAGARTPFGASPLEWAQASLWFVSRTQAGI